MIPHLPAMVWFLLGHCILGIAAGGAVLAGLLIYDIAGIGRLILASESPALAIAMLLGGLSITFGSAAMGFAVFLVPRERDPRS
jgi:hypothetical protein